MLERCYRQKPGIFYNHFMILNNIEKVDNELLILHCDDIIQILLDIREYNVSRCLYGSTVCDCYGARQGNNLSCL